MTDIFDLASTAVDELVELSPQTGTVLGVPGTSDRWDDHSPDGVAAMRAFQLALSERTRRADVARPGGLLAQAVLMDETARIIDAVDAGEPFADLNNIASPWQGLRDIFEQMPMATAGDWTDIAVRLETIDRPLTGYLATLHQGLDHGEAVAVRQVEAAIEQGGVTAGDGSTFVRLGERYDRSGVNDEALGRRLAAAIDHARSAYGSATEWLRADYLPHARPEDGVGIDRYVRAARTFLGETIDPHVIYAWGWEELTALQARGVELAAQIDPAASLAGVIDLMVTDPGRSAHSVDEFIGIMADLQHGALDSLAGVHFDVPEPIRRIDVKVAPPGGALAPYYEGPSEDFSRPGCVWYPIGDRTVFPLYDEVTTAYHEGFPGHHLQIGVQATQAGTLSRFHRNLVWYSGSGEGWALYAERLMGELGYLDRPDYELGLISSQLLRACRVVIDIGCHLGLPIPAASPFHPGEAWSYDLAVEMLETVAFTSPAMARSEVTRYLGWPGQAISYKLGEKAILDLRTELVERGGVDQRRFHAAVLGVGSIGLDLMRQSVRDDLAGS
ncbi:MAG: DUF885 domain-containing protein [Acidimicrobiales bacterium]